MGVALRVSEQGRIEIARRPDPSSLASIRAAPRRLKRDFTSSAALLDQRAR